MAVIVDRVKSPLSIIWCCAAMTSSIWMFSAYILPRYFLRILFFALRTVQLCVMTFLIPLT